MECAVSSVECKVWSVKCGAKIDVFLRLFFWTYVKIDVSCEVSVNVNLMSQNGTHAPEFAPCHNFAQR